MQKYKYLNAPSLQFAHPASMRYVVPKYEEKTPYGYKTYDPYSKLFEDRIVFLGTQIDDTAANDIMVQLLVLESLDQNMDITMYINSPGGSFTAMTAIYDTMQYIAPDVSTICLGTAVAEAAILLSAGANGKRMALPNSRIALFQPSTGEQSGYGQATDIEIYTQEYDRMRKWMEDTLAKHSGRTRKQVSQDIDRLNILSAKDAKEYGLVDEVLSTRPVSDTDSHKIRK